MNTDQPTLTREDIFRLFADVARRFQETDRRFQETNRKSQEVYLEIKETERQIRETSRQLQATDLQLKAQSQEMNRRFKELDKKMGRFSNRLGEFVEEMIKPALLRLFQSCGIKVHSIHRDVSSIVDGGGIEIDLLLVNGEELVAVECKSKLNHQDIDEHLLRLQKLKKFLPAYIHHRVFGAVAAMVMSDEVARYAETRGLYVLVQNGEHIELHNGADFRPCDWSQSQNNMN